MNFIPEIFEFGALKIQPTARGSEGASIGFGSHFQLLVAGKKSTDLLRVLTCQVAFYVKLRDYNSLKLERVFKDAGFVFLVSTTLKIFFVICINPFLDVM